MASILVIIFIILLSLIGCKAPSGEVKETKEEAVETKEEAAISEEEWSYEWASKQLGLEGTTISAIYVSGEFFDQCAREVAPEFTEMTGINVIIEDLGAGPLHDKIITDWRGETGHDVLAMSVWQGYEFLPMHGFEPLEKYLEDPILLDPEFDVDDFVPKMVNGWCKWNDEAGGTPTFTGVDGTLYLLPGPHDGQVIMCYRTDLLEEYGLDVPETWDDYLEVAKTINNPDEGIYGTTLHGLANEHLMLNDFFKKHGKA